MLKIKEKLDKGIDRLTEESFYFEKTKQPVDLAAIYFIDQSYNLTPSKFISLTKSDSNIISEFPKKTSPKIDGYFLPKDSSLYSKNNAKFVDFITTNIVEASIDAHQVENFIFYDDQTGYHPKKYFYEQLNQKILEKNDYNKDLIKYYPTQLNSLKSQEGIEEELQAIIFICVDPNLLPKTLEKIESALDIKKYQVISLAGGGYNLIRPETQNTFISFIKNNKSISQDTKIIICSHGPNSEENENNCYNCGGYQIFEKLKGSSAYDRAKNDLFLSKEILKNNGITNVDTIMSTSKYISEYGEVKLYQAEFKIV